MDERMHGYGELGHSIPLSIKQLFPHITVGFLFSCLHPARLPRPSPVPSRPPSAASLSSHLTTTHLIHTHTHTHAHTHHKTCLIHNSSHTPHLIHHITHHSSHTHTHITKLISHHPSHTQLISRTTHLTRRSAQSLLKELRRGLAPQWPRLLVAWQGAVHRASRRSCGADWRRRGG